MKSDGGIIYHAPPKPLWLPRSFATRPTSLAVRFKTQLCDGDGRVLKDLQQGWNEITDFGMDSLAGSSAVSGLVNYLHLSDTLGTAKRVASGGVTLTLTITTPTNIAVVASAGFFLAGDVGNTLSIDGLGQELKITAFTDSQHVTCSTRAGVWIPGSSPGAGPFASYGVHFTSTSTLANQFNKYNTYDTTASNFNAELNDSGNSRSIHQRIFLSGAAGSNWTINQLGWSDGNVGNNVFGKVNLASPDLVGTGFKYRVILQVFSGYTPINIASQSINWGGTIGTYDLAMRQEAIPKDSGTSGNFLIPSSNFTISGRYPTWTTAAFTLASTKWEGDAGYNAAPHGLVSFDTNQSVSDSAYTNGQYKKTRTWKLLDTFAITGATGVTIFQDGSSIETLSIKPNSGTITKPAGFWAALSFDIFWTRALTN